MGLGIAVMTSQIVDTPVNLVSEFVHTIMSDPDLTALKGPDVELDDVWGPSWEGNAIYEFTQEGLEARADIYASSNTLSVDDHTTLKAWVSDLPWNGSETIMLHLWD